MMIRAYRIRGHLIADLDPLGLKERLTHEELNPETYGFGAADMDREVYINNVLGLGEYATVQQILDRCRATYCGRIGVEFMHITDPAQEGLAAGADRGDRQQDRLHRNGEEGDP